MKNINKLDNNTTLSFTRNYSIEMNDLVSYPMSKVLLSPTDQLLLLLKILLYL